MAEKNLTVFRIEYELLPSMSTWTAFIAAFSHEEALLYLKKRVGAHRITSSGMQCRLDAISEEVRNIIINTALGKQTAAGEQQESVTKIDVSEDKQAVEAKEKKKSFARK